MWVGKTLTHQSPQVKADFYMGKLHKNYELRKNYNLIDIYCIDKTKTISTLISRLLGGRRLAFAEVSV